MRGDTDFILTKHIDQLAELVDFFFSIDKTGTLQTSAEALSESQWSRLARTPNTTH